MNKATLSRLEKLEGVQEDGQLAIVWVHPDKREVAEAEAGRLETQGRRVILVRWQWDEGDD